MLNPIRDPRRINIPWANRKCRTSSFQNYRNDWSCGLPGQSPKDPLLCWGIHLCPTGPEYLTNLTVKQKYGRTVLSCPCQLTSQCPACPQFGQHSVSRWGQSRFSQFSFATFEACSIWRLFYGLIFEVARECCQEPICLTVLKRLLLLNHQMRFSVYLRSDGEAVSTRA